MDTKLIDIAQLIPEGASFKLKATGNTYQLRPFSLEDESWMAKRFGSDISKIFRELQMMPIAEMAYHQMIDRSDFVKQKVKFINDEGEEAFHEIGGIKLFFSMIQGMNEKITIVQALMATIGISRPMMEKMVEGSEEKKSPLVQPTTPKSSTPLATNTDGQQSTSSVEPSEK